MNIAAPATSNLFRKSQPRPASRCWTTASTTACAWLPLDPAMPSCGPQEEPLSPSGFAPVAASILFFLIHSQFSASTSSHSERNLAPPSPALTLPFVAKFPFACEPPPVEFHHRDREARNFRSALDVETEPVVISSLVMNDKRPIKMVETSHAGLKDFGWKSDMERQSLVDGWNRPDGVCMRIAGGANG